MSARSPRAGSKRLPAPAPPVGVGADCLYSIGALAQELKVTTRAIRFYEARGLIAPVRRGVHRSYSRRDRARLKLILRGKNLGFTLEEVAQYLKLYDADPAQIAQTQMLLAHIERAIEDLQVKRLDIERTLKELKEIRSQCMEHLGCKGVADAGVRGLAGKDPV
jgi:DNA-binding transcriptional MerR regulator